MFVLMREMVGVYRKQHRDTFDKNSLRYSISKFYITIYLLYYVTFWSFLSVSYTLSAGDFLNSCTEHLLRVFSFFTVLLFEQTANKMFSKYGNINKTCLSETKPKWK
jgi:hypothetical protein